MEVGNRTDRELAPIGEKVCEEIPCVIKYLSFVGDNRKIYADERIDGPIRAGE
jgi:hypothetical protein